MLKEAKIHKEVKSVLARLESKNTQFARSRKSKVLKQPAPEPVQQMTLVNLSQSRALRDRTTVFTKLLETFDTASDTYRLQRHGSKWLLP